MSGDSRRRRLSWSGRVLLALFLSGAILFLWAFWWEPGRLVVREVSLELPGWGTEPPLRAVLLADLHVGSPRNGIDQLRDVVERANAQSPDVVLIAGDFVIDNVFGGRFVSPEEIGRELARLEAPLGVFAVLGNHDRWLSASRVEETLTGVGITVLENQAVPVDARGRELWIAGVADFWTGHPDVDRALGFVEGDGPVLLLTHNPDLFPEVDPRVSLTLAGHTHGGQVILPIVGRAITPSRFGERYAVGHIEELGHHMYVSSGIGTSRLGVRFRVPPEVVVLELGPCDGCAPPAPRHGPP